jgi:hypothetical protein
MLTYCLCFSEAAIVSRPYANILFVRCRSDHSIDLVESAGWTLRGTGEAPSKHDMMRVLSKLSGIWIRGGYYRGHEDSYISTVKLVAGAGDATPK